MRIFYTFLSLLCIVTSANQVKGTELPTISDQYSEYSKFVTSEKMEDLVPLLEGATISFSDFNKSSDITCFKYIVPDTIWIKERPKKNPKEGKHYTLRYLYHSEFAQRYSFGKKVTYERTPAIEFVGAQFLVDRLEPIPSTDNSTINNYKIYLTNIVTGEKLEWTYLKSSYGRNNGIVHIVSLSENLGLVGHTLYSADKEGYVSTKYKNLTKHNCISVDAQINLKNDKPQFTINFTTIDESNREATYTLPLKSSSSKFSSNNHVWLDETQVEEARNTTRTYEIDYIVRLDSPDDFPFDFSFILGVADTFLTPVYQKLKPEGNIISDSNINLREIMFIGDKLTAHGTDYYKGVIEGKAFYVKCSDVKLTAEAEQQLDSLLSFPREVRDAFFEATKALSFIHYMSKLEEAINEVNSHASKGISIPSWGVYDMSEYTDGTGIRFRFHNPTKKVIKYVNVSFVGYNSVDDRVGRTISKRCIGPIDPEETATYEFEYAWFTDVVQYAKITSLSVQYKDGTTKTISNPRSVMWSDETSKIMSSSKLSNLKFELFEPEE